MLEAKWAEGKFVCVGLDSDYEKISPKIRGIGLSPGWVITSFNQAIISATKDLVCAYKLNMAFYLAHGEEGLKALDKTVMFIRINAPDVPVILDAKVADIGNTNEGYVKFAFDYLQADAITVHPYLGKEAMRPFLERKDKGVIVLCKTSNAGSNEFQNRLLDPEGNLYKAVAFNVDRSWNERGNCALVAGATYPEELAEIRKIAPDMPLLIPGVGKQGGDVAQVVKAAGGKRMIINSSSGIIFASKGEDFAEAARRETQKLHDQIALALAST
jgi:orotidine-5'-phosphate decarboxylase